MEPYFLKYILLKNKLLLVSDGVTTTIKGILANYTKILVHSTSGCLIHGGNVCYSSNYWCNSTAFLRARKRACATVLQILLLRVQELLK